MSARPPSGQECPPDTLTQFQIFLIGTGDFFVCLSFARHLWDFERLFMGQMEFVSCKQIVETGPLENSSEIAPFCKKSEIETRAF